MLVNAISTGSAIKGSALMLAFALGTLPNLLAMSLLVGATARLARSGKMRVFSGIAVISPADFDLIRQPLLEKQLGGS